MKKSGTIAGIIVSKESNGFTLVETLVSMMVLAISLTMILQLFSGGMNSKRRAESYARAVFRAAEVMETVLVTASFEEQVLEGSFEDGYSWTATITQFIEENMEDTEEAQDTQTQESADTPAGSVLYQVDVDLFWDVGDKTKQFSLSTLKWVK